MAFGRGDDRLSGRMGGRVYRQVDGETIVSAMPCVRDPNTPKQQMARRRLERATDLWGELTDEARDRWRLHGLKLGRRADLVFRGLAAKYMQVHDVSTAPTEPPASGFTGDGIVVRAQGQADTGTIAYVPSGPNAPGVVTELMMQRLTRHYCKPKADGYRTQGFVAFEGEPAAVRARPGPWACAVRFVRADTGQASAIVPIGTVVVGG